MNIIYPPLVEEAIQFYCPNQELTFSEKAGIYRELLAKEIILPNGQPTPKALRNGWVKDYYEEEKLSFTEFLELYPLFAAYDEGLFVQVQGFWEIPMEVRTDLLAKLQDPYCSYEEKIQIEAYLSDRQ